MCFVKVGDLTERIKKKKSTPLSNIQCNKIVNFILSNTSFGKRFEMVNKYAHPSSFGQRMLQDEIRNKKF
ncbi:hypothetical protein ACOTWR_06590 [Aliarcobacter butzleri]|uniref:hypothetical protein n=1 Tax=Aliarcobacter butzleri TaxID=28197 RepID=UPI0021B18912|nr:hypothetical protein [Aliarcobacter butzleri]MCT7564120.1 hypothetical protein [Aliarcobacter butzleri]MCT7578721.1 hypothetical protein [Aliarcobacter butzleri]MCT7647664.1 hypothetical protein [Aliarcobacter butzleri]